MAEPTLPVHVPVLLVPVLAAAAGARRVVDATLGDGGHAEALRRVGAEVLGIDRDPAAIAVSRQRLGDEGIRYLRAAYGAPEALDAIAAFRPDFILLDLGVSSRQLDEAARGFTFRPGAPLDMRMGRTGPTAAEFLNQADEAELARVFYEYGDERQSRRLAREIVRRRERGPFAISDDLVNAVRATLGPRAGPPEFARLFQAVRIAVNDELAGLADRAAGLPGRARARRPTGGHHLSFGRGPAGQAGVPRVGQRLRLSAGPADLHLPRPAARAGWCRGSRSWPAPTKWRQTPARAARTSGSSRRAMRLKGRHWLMLWLLVFLCVLIAITTRQTAGIPYGPPAARPARGADDARGPPGGPGAADPRGVEPPGAGARSSERALGLHEPADSEFVLFALPPAGPVER